MKAQLKKVEQGYILCSNNESELLENNIPFFESIYDKFVIATNFKPGFTCITIVRNNKLIVLSEVNNSFFENLLNEICKDSADVEFSFSKSIIVISMDEKKTFTEEEIGDLLLTALTKTLWIKHPGLMIEREILDFLGNINPVPVLKFIILSLIGLALIQILV